MGKVNVTAITPIKYMIEGEEAKTYGPGDKFEVLDADVKQLHEAGAIEVSEDVAKDLESQPSTIETYQGAPTTIAADNPGTDNVVLKDGEPVSEGTTTPLASAPQPQDGQQPTEQEISETLDGLQ